MADSQFVPKSHLISMIREIVSGRDTGLVSILTDTNRSVLLKFSDGKLVHSYGRTRDVADVIQVLNESQSLKISFAPIPPENKPELMPSDVLIQLLETGSAMESDYEPTRPISKSGTETVKVRSAEATQPARAILERLASEYIGIIAEMIVEEAFENVESIEDAIEYIAKMIPDNANADKFKSEAKSNTHLHSI